MGNCFKKASFITDKYLFEPLTSDEEGCFGESPVNDNGVISFEVKQKLNDLNLKITEMDTKINILEKNTMENFKSISDDIYYINEKQNQENSQSLNQSESESDSESKFASFIN
jgi:hypothetical protein